MKKTVLITGASTGIGRAAAVYFQQKGWNVAATMRSPKKESELGKLSGIKLYPLDVTDRKSVDSAVKSVLKDFGRIDALVNNAGYGAVGPFEAADDAQIRRQFETNVFGLMNVTKRIITLFREQRSGTIINISSVGGQMTFPLYSLYHGTKWAVEGFSESLQYELKEFNISVKIVEPGAIKTDFYSRSRDIISDKKLSAYDSFVERVMKNSARFASSAVSPDVVAAVIYRAATDNSPRLRYPAGGGAPMILFLRKILPDRVFVNLIGRVSSK